MGAVHEGHAALVEAARTKCRHVVASVFVNPTQFGPSEDFTAYPRDEAGDAAKLEAAGCDLLYAPDVAEIYPHGPAVAVSAGPLGDVLEGKFRTGHFDGVVTVVATLFAQAMPDVAVFGEKDYQQLLVIREFVRTRGLDIEILAVHTVRAPDGLALSSRNAYLSAEQRDIAPALYRTLLSVAERVLDKRTTIPREISHAVALLAQAGFDTIDYVAVCDARTLAPVEELTRPARVLGAARIGRTRLIDNVPVLIPGS
jgi:pantoate--beta-alanine ligase